MHQQACVHAQRVLSMLNQQRELGQFCDVMLNTSTGQVYLAHRNILACFSKQFQHGSSTTTQSMQVNLPQECPPDGLELLLDFLYTGELKLENVSWEQVHDAANALSVSDTLIPAQPLARLGSSETNLADLTATEAKPESSVLSGDKADGMPAKGRNKCRQKAGYKLDSATGMMAAPLAITITTRSGRRVKEPRRLVGHNSKEMSSQIGLPRRQGPTSKEDLNPKAVISEAESQTTAQDVNQPEVVQPCCFDIM